jgi:hypothetical protein
MPDFTPFLPDCDTSTHNAWSTAARAFAAGASVGTSPTKRTEETRYVGLSGAPCA